MDGWKRITNLKVGEDYIATEDANGNLVYDLLVEKRNVIKPKSNIVFISNKSVNIYLDKEVSVYKITDGIENKIKLSDLCLNVSHVFKKSIKNKKIIEKYQQSGSFSLENLNDENFKKEIKVMYEHGYIVDFDTIYELNAVKEYKIRYNLYNDESDIDFEYGYAVDYEYEISFCDLKLASWNDNSVEKKLCIQRYNKMIWVAL